MTGAGAVHVRGLVVDYATNAGPLRALNCDQLTIRAGSSLAIIGPSGCGKSTMLCMLAGLAMPTAGTVAIGGTVLSDLTEAARVAFRKAHIGVVYQADNLLPFLSVTENIRLQLALCGDAAPALALVPALADAATRTADLLARLGIGALGDRLPDQLSGGQRQRVAIARAIVHRPTLILADEPTGALDTANAAGVIDLLLDMHRRLGATLVVVTHDSAVAARMQRVVTLRAGSVTQDSEMAHVH